MDDYGVVEMRGQLLNGMESGLFEEYDDNEKVVWRGYYRDGKRYSEVVKSGQLEGYYDEKSAENGRLLSIAQYDKDLHDKNGRCLEYENGSLRSECVYENGVKKHTSRQFVNERMTMFDSNGKKVYEGKWFGDMKSGFLCHEKMEGMSGYFKEVGSSGQLISVSEYDELNVFKNGKCFDMENGKVKRVCVYEKDEMKRVMQEFNGSTMTEYNENGVMSYLGEWKGDMKSGFVRDGKGIEYEKDGETALYSGQWKSEKRDGKGTEYRDGHALYTGEWKNGMRNGKGKEMDESGRVVFVGEWKDGKGKGKEMDENGNAVYEGEWWNGKRNGVGEVLKGTRWVGYWKDGKMNGMEYEKDGNGVMKRGCLFENGEMKRVVQEFNGGKMVEYDENGRKVYEGEYKGNVEKGFVREGFGKGFRIVECSQKSKYDSWKTLFSYCICYRRNELATSSKREEMVDGIWKDGKYLIVVVPSSLTSKPQVIKKLRIGNRRYNDGSMTELKLSGLARLKRIVIGDSCFGKVRVFELDGLCELESVVIGEESFRIRDGKRSDGSCRIVNCPKLKSIQIGNRSCEDHHSFELNNLPSLQSIDIGMWCFGYTPSLSLTNLPQLQSVKLGESAFIYVHTVVFENLPKLQSIQLEGYALHGDGGDDRKTISKEPYNYKNTLTMRNLPSLTQFKGNDYNFWCIGAVILENIPQLSSSGIDFGNYCFQYTYSLQSSNATALESYIRRESHYL
ncbi:hypothetical protein WA588_002520 [Blastocystis sp. NMH]